MTLLTERFNNHPAWHRLHQELANFCATLPEITSDVKKQKFVHTLQNIKIYLQQEGLSNEETRFLDEEIEQYNQTTQIEVHTEDDDIVERRIINWYATSGGVKEGVVAIHKPLNYTQLERITNGVYRVTEEVKFFISKEKQYKGKIVASHMETVQDIPVARLLASTKMNEAGEPLLKTVKLFGELNFDKKKWVQLKEVKGHFYLYRFIDYNNQEYVLLTNEHQLVGDYIIDGVVTYVDDAKPLTSSAKIGTKIPYLFVHTIQERIVKFENREQFFEHTKTMGVTRETFFNYPFVKQFPNGKQRITLQPEWFKHLIWAWLLHSSQNEMQPYPLHLMIVGPKGSGKSTLLNVLHTISKETRKVYGGDGSTIKGLIPSFRDRPPKIGYLGESVRFSFLDEFLRCALRSTTNLANGDLGVNEMFAQMNDLLEHQAREFSSGMGEVNLRMRSRVIAGTNPVREIHTVEDLITKFDESFTSRWLIFWEREESECVTMIRDNTAQLQTYDYHFASDDFLSILDFLWTVQAAWDSKRLRAIYDSCMTALSAKLKTHYTARHWHHLQCLMDGIIKERCLFEHDADFIATEDDYALVESIWHELVRSWVNPENIKHLSKNIRERYIPEDAQWIYNKLCASNKPMSREELTLIAKGELSLSRFYEVMQILDELGLVVQGDGYIRAHFVKSPDLNKEGELDLTQSRL